MKSQPLNNCSLFDLLTSQPIHHVQTENSRNFISFLFRFNFIPLYSYSCLFTLRINIWSDVIFFQRKPGRFFFFKKITILISFIFLTHNYQIIDRPRYVPSMPKYVFNVCITNVLLQIFQAIIFYLSVYIFACTWKNRKTIHLAMLNKVQFSRQPIRNQIYQIYITL